MPRCGEAQALAIHEESVLEPRRTRFPRSPESASKNVCVMRLKNLRTASAQVCTIKSIEEGGRSPDCAEQRHPVDRRAILLRIN